MFEQVFNKLLNAYGEEGYDVSVGLNPWRESPDGSFAVLSKRKSSGQIPPISNLHYQAKAIPVVYPDLPKKQRFLKSVCKLFVIALKRNRFTKVIFKDPFVEGDHRPALISETFGVKYFDTSGGIAIDEILFFDVLLNHFNPKNEFLIGVAAGWSTIALGLISPNAKLYAMDNLSEGGQARDGIDLTQRIAKKLNIELEVFIGSSPQQVPAFLDRVNEKMDFIFVDGLHTNDQVLLDFEAALPYAANASILAFHDVLNWKMLSAWEKIVEVAVENGFKHQLLRRTSSGIGLLYKNIGDDAESWIKAFSQPNALPSMGAKYDKTLT